jgi:integrase
MWEKTLWRMLYESAARAGEVLALDVEDLDRDDPRHRAGRRGRRGDPPGGGDAGLEVLPADRHPAPQLPSLAGQGAGW